MVSGLTTALAVLFGFVGAMCVAGLERRLVGSPRWRSRLAALALPPFLVTNCWLDYLGAGGAWRGWLPFDMLSLSGTVWILSLLLWPIPMLAVCSAWHRLEPAQLESDMAVTGWPLIRGLLLPLAGGPLALGAVLVFILALNNFAVPAILQVKVSTAEMWILFNTTFDTIGALRMSWPLIVGPLLLLVLVARRQVAWPHLQSAVSAKVVSSTARARLVRERELRGGVAGVAFGGPADFSDSLGEAHLDGTARRARRRAERHLELALVRGSRGDPCDWFKSNGSGERQSITVACSRQLRPRLAAMVAVSNSGRAARHCVDHRFESPVVFGLLSERRDCDSGVSHSIPGFWLEWNRARDDRGGSRFDRRRAAHGRNALADAAPRSMAANRATGCRRLVCGFSPVPLGCRIHDSGRAARRGNARRADLQSAALWPQCPGKRTLSDVARAGGCAAAVVDRVVCVPPSTAVYNACARARFAAPFRLRSGIKFGGHAHRKQIFQPRADHRLARRGCRPAQQAMFGRRWTGRTIFMWWT